MPLTNKKAFTLPTQRYDDTRLNGLTSNPQHKYSQHINSIDSKKTLPQKETFGEQGFRDYIAAIDALPISTTKTRYTRRHPESVLANGGVSRHDTSSPSSSPSNKKIFGDYDPATRKAIGINERQDVLSRSINSPRKYIEGDLELDYLQTETKAQRRMSDESHVKQKSNPIHEYKVRNRYDEGDEESQRNSPIHRNWYDQETDRSKVGNSNLDIVSLHSMISKKSLKRDNYSGWMEQLAYSFVGLLLWTLIVICIEEIDGTVGQKVCHQNQEIRYWGSYVCLVVIVTAITIYFHRGNLTETLMIFMLNTVILMTAHHVPLSCIQNKKLDDRGMGRLRGGLILFTILTLVFTWLLRKYLANKKALPWTRHQ